MNLNRDEFLLLSRTGRSPYSTRAGPRPDERLEAGRTARRLRARDQRLRSEATPRLWPHRRGKRWRRPAASERGRIDEGAYFEMEFAVGFPAEEETLR